MGQGRQEVVFGIGGSLDVGQWLDYLRQFLYFVDQTSGMMGMDARSDSWLMDGAVQFPPPGTWTKRGSGFLLARRNVVEQIVDHQQRLLLALAENLQVEIHLS